MLDFYEQRKVRNFLYSWPFLAVLGLVFLVLLNAAWGAFRQERETAANKAQRLAYLEELQSREESLRQEIDRLNTDRGIEAEIRQKFEVAKSGEEVIVIVDAPPATGGNAHADSKGFFRRMIDFLMFR